ncbi:MAG: response regulator [Treponemataceae bacterium]|nr:response regulator [Treponemataceae bacterium]
MKSKKRDSIKIVSVFSGFVVAIIFVVGTFWSGRRASDDTEKAVRNVSLLYMNELTNRYEQVVATTLSTYINDMEIALGLLKEENLASDAALHTYQAEMKRLYGLEKFAFVDTHGTIYTSRGTRTDIGLYKFDYNALSAPEISIKDVGGDKKVVVAAPVDRLPFNGDLLVACFMEIDMEKMLADFSLQFVNVGITFCTIYTKDGVSFSNTFLDGPGNDANLLDALENARFENGYSLEKMRRDFREGNEGIASFTYNDIRETMYYKPVRNTDWMLTYLIHESVISDQIISISNGIITRSHWFSAFAIVVLVALFIGIFVQMQKSTKLMLEKEVADTENRITQEELRKQLALQQEISRQERRHCAQDNMITALASDYRSVYYVNLDTDDGICYRTDGSVEIAVNEGDHIPFRQTFIAYANEFVAEEYRQKFLDFIDPENIRSALHKNALISLRYLVNHKGKGTYEMLRMAGVRKEEDRVDGNITLIGVGFSDIDEEMRESLAKNQVLSDALKMAEEASKAKTAFLSSMSHEIRTPMNAIIGLDTIALKNKQLPAETRAQLEKIGMSARHLLSLINDILDMSRIESGRMVLKNEEFSFRMFLDQINTIVDSQCRDKKLRYECSVRTKIDEHYIGDDMKLKQVLINILGNAIKFTPSPGTVSLAIERTATFENQTTLRFVISDTGIGMDKEFLPRIFDAFAQEDDTTTSKYGGSGLGMAITKNIVELMNGNITVESEKGKGSTFTVTVTLLNTEQKAAAALFDVNPADLKVLVIDDDEVACTHARIVLEEIGIAVDTCLDGEAALKLIQNQVARHEPYNLILVDWQLPDADGVELTRKICERIGQETTVIILTAYNWATIETEAKAAGVDSFMSKPLFASSVMSEFTAALRKKHRANVAAETPKVDLHGRRILLAEDMQINMEIMKELLGMEGMEVEHAENGQIAVDMFRASEPGHFDVVLMDVRMPVMDGLKATAAIRALDHPDAKDIPIIAMTANAFDEDVQHSLQAGMTAHLTKPVEPEKLYRSLKELIGARLAR